MKVARELGTPGPPRWLSGVLLPLWVLSWATFALLWPGAAPWVHVLGRAGALAFVALITWWAVRGFTGYERFAGLRIIRREREGGHGRLRALLLVAAATPVVGVIALELGVRHVAIVVAVALGTFVSLLFVLARRFSVFGTISIVGVVLGVAALIVVQSVATGFQHEFERRVLGVYAHINVTRAQGLSEYRRFEAYLRTVPGVVGASPFVYYAMALAPWDAQDDDAGTRRASVLVKGIEPATAPEVIDLPSHLGRDDTGPGVLSDLITDIELLPVADREDELLPSAVVATADPRGLEWFEPALTAYRALPESRQADAVSAVARPDAESLPTMYVGRTLARELDLEVGDVVNLMDPGATFDHSERPRFQYYRVAGLFHAGFQEYDTRLVYVHVKELQRFKYRGRDMVSGVDLRLDDRERAPEVAAVLDRTIGRDDYSILEWQELNENLFQSIATQKLVITIILSLVITVACFNVLAALWTMVVRRTAEIAIMMSMGATEDGVARIFQFTGMTIGLAGSLAGVGFGLVLCYLVQAYGYTLDPEVYFIERLPVEINPVQVLAVLGMTLAICFLATIPPSLRAAKLRPVEGLRYE